MSDTTQTLDPFTIPLHGMRLIEASAGTGKTHAIAGLYLRLLLQRGLEVDRILVVTFTNAATEELRDRIRTRIRDVLHALEGDAETSEEAKRYAALADDPQEAIQRLRDSLIRLDESAIFTIHGFCQRVLSENALESGVLFEAEFVGDDQALQQAVVEDFWRRRVQTLPLVLAKWVRSRWAGPDALLSTLKELLRRPDAELVFDPIGDTLSEDLLRPSEQQFEQLAANWSQCKREVVELLQHADGLSKDKSRGYTPERIGDATAALDQWIKGGFLFADLSEAEFFSSVRLAELTKKNKETPQHSFFDQCRDYVEQYGTLERHLTALLLSEAREWCLEEAKRRKRRRKELTYDDLLQRVDEALSGPGGQVLAERLRSRYPAVLIDEFQDTDPLQYRIFRQIYAVQGSMGSDSIDQSKLEVAPTNHRSIESDPIDPIDHHDPIDRALFMIGDPKQAIYSFRGADVFTYIRARRDTPPEFRYTLDTNWRSSKRLVTAVNRLFGHNDNPFRFEDIPFMPMKAAGRADEKPLTINGKSGAPLNIWFLAREGGKKDVPRKRADPLIAVACVAEIGRLLILSEQGKALIGERPLGPGDIALLVRNRFEAAWIQSALRRARIGSVIQSRDSVLETEEARELALLLRAVAMPGSESVLRAALSTSLLGKTAADLYELASSPEVWEQMYDAFDGYHRLWLEHGFMAMFTRLLHENELPKRLLQGDSGERRLTNLLHLTELLQAASQSHDSPERLLRWFADERGRPNGDSEEQLLCLESDERLVRIVTIHKSKGLQYPVVFLPYLFRGAKRKQEVPLACHDMQDGAGGELLFDLGSDQFDLHWQWAEEEHLAEDARLLYVALTRAEHCCYLPWGAIYGFQDGILAKLLHPAGPGSDEEMLRELHNVFGDVAAVQPLSETSLSSDGEWSASAQEGVLQARTFKGVIDHSWRVTSYSGLTAGLEQPAAKRLAESEIPTEGATGGDFPAGTVPGLFLHSLLENLSFPDARDAPLRKEVERLLDLYGLERKWATAAERLVANLLDTPLDGESLRLRELGDDKRRNEMAFHYPLAGLTPELLNLVLEGFSDYMAVGEKLTFNPVKGLMTGFIDLTFEHQGRFYLADYKSNLLGDSLEHYDIVGLTAAMREHRYDLQYLIYTVALHRYLAGRLPDYDYDTHFGGVYYLFPRGMSPQQGNRYGVFHDKPDGELIGALDSLFRGAA